LTFPSFQVDTWQIHMHVITCTLTCFQVHITHCHMHVAKFLGAHWHGFQMHIATCTYWQVVNHGCYFMSLRTWMWVGEHEEGSRTEFFFKYSFHIDEIFEKYSLTPRTKYLVMWRNILLRVHGQMIFVNENMDDKLRWTFSWTLAISFSLQNLNKRNKMEEIYVGLFFKNCHMKCWNHISISTSYFLNAKYILAL
jgi:hypothetical protein